MAESEWITVLKVLVGGGFLAIIAGGARAWWNARREDQKARVDEDAAEKKALEARVEKLQDKVESLLMDAKAKAEDDKREKAERMAMDAKQLALSEAITGALKEATVIMARIEKGSP